MDTTPQETRKHSNKTARRIRSRMEALSITSAELSRRLFVSEATIHNWRTGVSLPGNHIFDLAQALNCDARWLLRGGRRKSEVALTDDEFRTIYHALDILRYASSCDKAAALMKKLKRRRPEL